MLSGVGLAAAVPSGTGVTLRGAGMTLGYTSGSHAECALSPTNGCAAASVCPGARRIEEDGVVKCRFEAPAPPPLPRLPGNVAMLLRDVTL